jgi:7-carboxy-7-deazaguanine synthase
VTKLLVNEIFGPTWQGEGFTAGQFCLFVRLALCNLECVWCDTAQTWAYTEKKADVHQSHIQYDKDEEIHFMTPEEVVAELEKLWPIRQTPCIVVISGGEPLMQKVALPKLLQLLYEIDCDVQIETAGTIVPSPELDGYVYHYNVSPKLENSGNPLGKRRKIPALQFFAQCSRAGFKFVCQDDDDLCEVDEIVHDFSIPASQVQIMPEGVDEGTIMDTAYYLAPEVLKRGYGMSLRNHIFIYGNIRGV